MVIAPFVSGVVGGVVAVFFGVYGPDISDTVHTGPPMQVTVRSEPAAEDGGDWWLPDRVPASNGSIASGQAAQLGRSQHAVDVDHTHILVTVEGRRSRTVVITDVRAKIVSRQASVGGGTLFILPAQGGSDDIPLDLDLDESNPRARQREAPGKLSNPYFDSHTVTVANGEVVTYDIDCHLFRGNVLYDLEFDAIVDGKPTQLTVANGSQPFHTMGVANRFSEAFTYSPTNASIDVAADPSKPCAPTICQPLKLAPASQ